MRDSPEHADAATEPRDVVGNDRLGMSALADPVAAMVLQAGPADVREVLVGRALREARRRPGRWRAHSRAKASR